MAGEDDLKFEFLPQLPKDNLDDRTFEDLVAECILRIPRYCPEWTDHNPSDPGITLIELFAWLTDQMLLRFNKVPRRNYITFLELLGIRLQPPASATTEITFYISEPDNFPFRVPAGTEVGTSRTATEEAIIFSSDRELFIGRPRLRYFLTSRTAEEPPRVLRDTVTHQWTRQENGEWGGAEQTLFDEQPEIGNSFYLICEPGEPLEGNVLAITLQGLAATPTGIDPDHPPRIWEAWDGEKWQNVLLKEGDDHTKGFSFNQTGETGENPLQSADIVLHLPQGWPVTIFTGYEGRWIRCRYRQPAENQPGYLNSPRITSLKVRALGGTISASHSQVIRDEVIGISEGIPGQTFQLTSLPILERRQEEYLIVTPAGGIPQTWQEVPDFADSTPESRHYTLDPLTGKIQFGPLIQEPSRLVEAVENRAKMTPLPAVGNYPTRRISNANGPLERQYGSIPPRGAEIRMRQYRCGGGRQGNVERGTLTVLKTAIPYITRVTNPEPARGGADAESLQQAVLRVPRMLRTRDRAVTQEDFETLTLEAARGGVAQALCVPPSSSGEAGTVTLLVVPAANTNAIEEGEGIPPDKLELSPELEEKIRNYLDERKLLGVQIRLRSAYYVGVSVQTQIGLEPAYQNPQAQEIIRRQLEVRLYRFLNPITGGIEGKGWTFGRPVYISDLIALFQVLPGVRYINPVLLYEIRPSQQGWQRNPEPVQMVDPGPLGLICSWKDRRLRSSHVINFLL